MKAQRGVALITALLMVAIALVLAAAMASRQHLDIRRTGGLLHGEQAWAYALGAENWARVVLRRDGEDSETDTLSEAWSTQPPVSFVEGGSIVGRLLDMQARFNVNNLVDNGEANPVFVDMYKRLLVRLDLEEQLADSLVDWMDSDIDVRFPDGAEDETYLLRDPPYRAANRPLSDVTELRLVNGYSAEVLDILQPYIVALPVPTPININTADALILSILAEDLTVSDGQALAEGRGEEGYESVDTFTQDPILAGKGLDPSLMSIKTDWFLMLTEASIGQGRARLASLIQRTGQDLRRRSR